MLFNSLEFLGFMALVYPLYLFSKHRWQNLLLLVASYVFYGSWNWKFLALILASTVVDYIVGLKLASAEDPHRRKRLLLVSVATNLGILGVFKYFNFFAESAAAVLTSVGLEADWVTLNIVLPVGISFYTFQTMSYTIDVHARKLEPERNFLNFALFVSFFPQLVAGPIERASSLVPQVAKQRRVTYEETTRGLYLILFGLFKKVAIADGVAIAVDSVYNSTGAPTGLDVAAATLCFALQIYGDFSGYSDVARGVSKMFGFELMTNFRMPYFSADPSEFWKRWHISLSSWLRDYLYIPLGGNRGGVSSTYRNLFLTMLFGGLWHGAAWNFVLWGAYQGTLLCIYRVFNKRGVRRPEGKGQVFAWAKYFVLLGFFFGLTCYGWLLFRASSFQQILDFTVALSTNWGDLSLRMHKPTMAALAGIVVLLVLDLSQELAKKADFYRRWPVPIRGGLYASMFFIFMMGLSNAPAQFIYFQF